MWGQPPIAIPANRRSPQPAPMFRPRTGKDFVLPGVPMLRSPTWTDDDDGSQSSGQSQQRRQQHQHQQQHQQQHRQQQVMMYPQQYRSPPQQQLQPPQAPPRNGGPGQFPVAPENRRQPQQQQQRRPEGLPSLPALRQPSAWAGCGRSVAEDPDELPLLDVVLVGPTRAGDFCKRFVSLQGTPSTPQRRLSGETCEVKDRGRDDDDVDVAVDVGGEGGAYDELLSMSNAYGDSITAICCSQTTAALKADEKDSDEIGSYSEDSARSPSHPGGISRYTISIYKPADGVYSREQSVPTAGPASSFVFTTDRAKSRLSVPAGSGGGGDSSGSAGATNPSSTVLSQRRMSLKGGRPRLEAENFLTEVQENGGAILTDTFVPSRARRKSRPESGDGLAPPAPVSTTKQNVARGRGFSRPSLTNASSLFRYDAGSGSSPGASTSSPGYALAESFAGIDLIVCFPDNGGDSPRTASARRPVPRPQQQQSLGIPRPPVVPAAWARDDPAEDLYYDLCSSPPLPPLRSLCLAALDRGAATDATLDFANGYGSFTYSPMRPAGAARGSSSGPVITMPVSATEVVLPRPKGSGGDSLRDRISKRGTGPNLMRRQSLLANDSATSTNGAYPGLASPIGPTAARAIASNNKTHRGSINGGGGGDLSPDMAAARDSIVAGWAYGAQQQHGANDSHRIISMCGSISNSTTRATAEGSWSHNQSLGAGPAPAPLSTAKASTPCYSWD